MGDPIYVYAIVNHTERALHALSSLAGMEDAAVKAIVEGALAAIVSSVAGTEWNDQALDMRVRDMEWLGPRATRHQEMLAALHSAAPAVLPLPFATLYRNEAAIHDLLRSRQQAWVSALERLAGTEEWTLKVFQQPALFEQRLEELSPSFREAMQTLRTTTPGKAYLMRKRLDVLRHEESVRATYRLSDEIQQEVAAIVREVAREALPANASGAGDGKPGASPARLVLKLALLIDRARRDEVDAALTSTLGRYGPLGYDFQMTGPWAPYSFATPKTEGGA
jgi:dihydroxyacetone kinase DhaKLM complex PTS-EIIA-like component DhaM